jgi:excisionase family DNA binding protein
MNEPAKPKIVAIGKAHGAPDVIVRLEQLEDSFLSGLQNVRAIKAELQKRTDQSPALEKLLDAKVVAELLGQLERWVYREAKAKRLPAVRLGKYWKFSPSALQKWLERQQTS